MTRSEDEIMKAIDEATRDIAVPEALRPQAIEELLEAAQAEERVQVHERVQAQEHSPSTAARRASSGWRRCALPWGIAACFVPVSYTHLSTRYT